jgi:hypothetical protein
MAAFHCSAGCTQHTSQQQLSTAGRENKQSVHTDEHWAVQTNMPAYAAMQLQRTSTSSGAQYAKCVASR